MIYFVRAAGTDYIKIGYTADLDSFKGRLQSLQTGQPWKLEVLRVVEDAGQWMESAFHGACIQRRPRLGAHADGNAVAPDLERDAGQSDTERATMMTERNPTPADEYAATLSEEDRRYRAGYMALFSEKGCKGYCVAGTGGREPRSGQCAFCGAT